MLKLKKSAKSRELSIILRDKPSLLTKTFFFALGYALFIHFSAFFLFHISPFKIGYEESIFPPVIVATDFPFLGTFDNVSIHLADEEAIPSYIIAPEPSLPEPFALIDHASSTQGGTLFDPFFSIEDNVGIQHSDTLFTSPTPKKAVAIALSGGLAERILLDQKNIDEDLKTIAADQQRSMLPQRFDFSVQLERSTGKIFWWEEIGIDHSSDRRLYLLAVELLKSLQFNVDPRDFVDLGDVEINFFPSLEPSND
jgi:hypothetical protein